MKPAEIHQLCLSFLVIAPFAAAYLYSEHWTRSRFLRRLDDSDLGAAGANITFFATGFVVLLIAIFASR